MIKRLFQNALIIGFLMLVFSHVDEAFATDTVEEIKTESGDDSVILDVEVTPSAKENTDDVPDRNVKFESIYDVETSESEEENNQNVLSPAEPKDEMIEEITNKDKIAEEEIEPDVTQDEPASEDDESEDVNDETIEDTEADDEAEDESEDAEDNKPEQPVYDERGKITQEGLTYLDDTVNRVMSEKIVKTPAKKSSNTQKSSANDNNPTFIRDRMTNFLSFQSLNDKHEKAFVRNLVVESIVVKYTSASKIPL